MDDERSAELSYFLASTARGHGSVTDAVRLVVRWVTEHDVADRVSAHVALANIASVAVLQRAGFPRAGRRRHPRLGDMTSWVYDVVPPA